MFDYGNYDNKHGYWRYENLVLQIEDYLDFLKVLYLSFGFSFSLTNSVVTTRYVKAD